MGIVVKQSIYNSIASYIGIVIGAINTIVLFPNFFTADQFGLTRVLAAASALFCSLSLLGIPGLTIKYFPYFKNKESKHNGFLFFIMLVPLVGYIVVLILSYFFKQDVIGFYSDRSSLFGEYYNYIPLLIFYLIYFNVFDAYLRALYKTFIYVFLQNVVLRLIWMVLIMLYYFEYLNFDEFMFYYVNAHALLLVVEIIYTAYIKELFVFPDFRKFDRSILKKMAAFSLFVLLGSSSGMFANTIDSLMIGALIPEGLSSVAFYSVALYIGAFIMVPYFSIVRIANSIISEAWKKDDTAKIAGIYKQSSVNLMIIGCLLFLGIWLNADNIFEILPKDYVEAKYVLFFIGLAKLYDVCTGVNGSVIQFSSFFRLMLYFNGLLIALLVATNYWLIPLYGIEGAAIATLISVFTVNTIRLLIIKAKMNILPFTIKSALVPLIAITVYAIVYFIPAFDHFIIDAVVRSLIIIVLFVPTVYAFNISEDFNRLIDKSLKLVKLKK